MNQILYISEGKTAGPLPIKTVARFFAIAIIIFGFAFIGQSAYAMFYGDEYNSVEMDNTIPEITFAQDGNNATITVHHNKGIKIIKYWWNNEDYEVETGNSQTDVILSDLPIPSGINTLNVSATDDNGKEANESHEYSYDGIAIDLSVVDNTYMKIVASDVNGMSYMTYRWNNDADVTVYPDEEGAMSIEASPEIPSGLNTLYITAVNAENITLNKKQEIKGNKKPHISLYQIDEDLFVTITDEEGLAEVTQQLNVDAPETIEVEKGQKVLNYQYHIGKENITVTITATDIEGISKTVRAYTTS